MFVSEQKRGSDDLRRASRLLDNDQDAGRSVSGQLLIGVNTRNLRTLEVDSERLQRLVPALPEATCVAESGLRTPDDAERVANWGYCMALVGTALMKSDDPTSLLAAMRAAGSRVLAA